MLQRTETFVCGLSYLATARTEKEEKRMFTSFTKTKWKVLLASSGISQKMRAKKIGIAPATLIKKIKDPKRFTIEEMTKIALVVGDEEAKDLFFGSPLQNATFKNETEHC